jgi:hypothetical protein
MPALAAEFELRRIGQLALRTNLFQQGAAFAAEFLPIRIFRLALGAIHVGLQWNLAAEGKAAGF